MPTRYWWELARDIKDGTPPDNVLAHLMDSLNDAARKLERQSEGSSDVLWPAMEHLKRLWVIADSDGDVKAKQAQIWAELNLGGIKGGKASVSVRNGLVRAVTYYMTEAGANRSQIEAKLSDMGVPTRAIRDNVANVLARDKAGRDPNVDELWHQAYESGGLDLLIDTLGSAQESLPSKGPK
jgi:hypothetical protein